MTTSPVCVERRIGQRFAFNLPVSLRYLATSAEGLGFTQNLSSRGVFLFTDMALSEGAEIELTLRMPSEITLGENMRVRCRGRVLRVVKPVSDGWKPQPAIQADANSGSSRNLEAKEVARSSETKSSETKSSETKIGLAVCLNDYEYLAETEDVSADFRRISALHSGSEIERVPVPVSVGPRNETH
jgi:PilZ domain